MHLQFCTDQVFDCNDRPQGEFDTCSLFKFSTTLTLFRFLPFTFSLNANFHQSIFSKYKVNSLFSQNVRAHVFRNGFTSFCMTSTEENLKNMDDPSICWRPPYENCTRIHDAFTAIGFISFWHRRRIEK